jgi:5-methylcytosine-specific restriction endonuclease McrA
MTWQRPPRWNALRKATFARYGRACYRCGKYANSVDHVVAQFLGGTDDLANLRPACGHCNSSTGASMGNRLRPRQPRQLTSAQRQAIALKNRQSRPW